MHGWAFKSEWVHGVVGVALAIDRGRVVKKPAQSTDWGLGVERPVCIPNQTLQLREKHTLARGQLESLCLPASGGRSIFVGPREYQTLSVSDTKRASKPERQRPGDPDVASIALLAEVFRMLSGTKNSLKMTLVILRNGGSEFANTTSSFVP